MIEHGTSREVQNPTAGNELPAVTILFGSHRDETTAELTLEHIPDDAIVYTEGTMLDHEYATRRVSLMRAVAEIRLEQGHYDARNLPRVVSLANTFRDRAKSRHDQYDHNAYALFRGLIDKNCVILPADYTNTNNDDLSPFSAFLEPDLWLPDEAKSPLRQAVSLAAAEYRVTCTRAKFYELREAKAVEHIALSLADFVQKDYIAAADDDRVFLAFGAAHLRSLPRFIAQQGLRANAKLVDDSLLPEVADYEAHMSSPRKVIRRQVVIDYLSRVMADYESHGDEEKATDLRDMILEIKKLDKF